MNDERFLSKQHISENNLLAKYIQKVARRIAVPVDKFANYCWFDFPFGTAPRAEREMYEKLALESAKVQISMT